MPIKTALARGALFLLALVVFSYGLLAAQLFLIGENPLDFHVDPLTVKEVESSNQYLVAPASLARVRPNRESPEFDATPRELMIAFDSIALAAPRTKLAVGGPAELWATYVQRTRLMRFPDYISVIAIGLPSGKSTLAVFSRSVYGTGDLGVNQDRVDAWLGQMSEALGEAK